MSTTQSAVTKTESQALLKGAEMEAGKTDKETATVPKSQVKSVADTKSPAKEASEKPKDAYDPDEWEDWEGPQRIRVTQATPELQALCRKLLGEIFSEPSLGGRRVLFDPDEVMDVAKGVVTYLESEPALIEDVPMGICIVGDLHGQLHDLNRVFDCHAKDGKPGYECATYLFLGDYVDRGRQSLEVVMALFCLKILYPDNFFMLRGNHEFIPVNVKEGFCKEINQRFEPVSAKIIFYRINETFCWLSIAAIVGGKYFCAHAGISPRGFTRFQMRGLIKPFADSTDDVIVHDCCWADPAVGLRGTAFNQERLTSINFGLEALVHALHCIGCTTVFRGHQMMEEGFDNLWFLCITVFTATATYEGLNHGACVDIDAEGKVKIRKLLVDKIRAERDQKLFGEKDEKDEKTTDDCGKGRAAMIEE